MKIVSCLILFLFGNCFLPYNKLSAQSDTGSFLSLQLGIQKHKEIDHIVSPFVYENNYVPKSVLLTWRAIRYYQYIQGEYYSSELSSGTGNTRSSNYMSLKYGYLRNLKPQLILNQNFNFSMGLEYANEFYLNQQYLTDLNASLNSSGYFTSALRFSGMIGIEIGKRHHLAYDLQTPIVQYIVRPGFSLYRPNEDSVKVLDNLKNGWVKMFHYGIQLHQSVRYVFEISRGFYFTGSYRYDVYRIPDPRAINVIQKGITYGVVIKL